MKARSQPKGPADGAWRATAVNRGPRTAGAFPLRRHRCGSGRYRGSGRRQLQRARRDWRATVELSWAGFDRRCKSGRDQNDWGGGAGWGQSERAVDRTPATYSTCRPLMKVGLLATSRGIPSPFWAGSGPLRSTTDKELAPFPRPMDGMKLSATASGRFPTNARNNRAALFWLPLSTIGCRTGAPASSAPSWQSAITRT